MLNILCCVGQAAEGKFHLVLVCFVAGRIHRICKKSHRLGATSMFVGLGVARTARQEGRCFLEASRNEEARGIPAKTLSVAFVAGRDWTRCKDRWASR